MIDLKRPKRKTESNTPEVTSSSDEEWAYRLRFSLEGPELRKLGADVNSFTLGKPMTATIEMVPINIRSNKSTGRERPGDEVVEFQIRKIDIPVKKTKYGAFATQKEKGPGE